MNINTGVTTLLPEISKFNEVLLGELTKLIELQKFGLVRFEL